MASRTTRAWAAGIVDGEGWIGLENRKGRRKKTPVVAVSNTIMDILTGLSENFGGKIHIDRRPSRPNAKTCWVWRLRGAKCVIFLKTIKIFLRGKKSKANNVINYGKYLLKKAKTKAV